MKFDNFIGWESGVISADFCTQIIQWFESKSEHIIEERRYGVHQDIIQNPYKFGSFQMYHQSIMIALKKAYQKYMDEYTYCPNDFSLMQHYKIQRSEPDKGFTGWHSEQGKDSNRFLVWTIYLNKTEGGSTQYLYQNKDFAPEPGLCVIWPASWNYTHRSSPDLKNTKYIMTGWWYYE